MRAWMVVLAACGTKAVPPTPSAGSVAPSEPPPLELVGPERTPSLKEGCVFLLTDHDAEQPFQWEVRLSAPDEDGLRWVQRVTSRDPAHTGYRSGAVIAEHTVDAYAPLLDPRLQDDDGVRPSYVSPRAVDLGQFPLLLRFIGPRPDAPTRLGEFELTLRDFVTPETVGSGCTSHVVGPDDLAGCTIVSGTCVDVFAAHHGLSDVETL